MNYEPVIDVKRTYDRQLPNEQDSDSGRTALGQSASITWAFCEFCHSTFSGFHGLAYLGSA